MALAILKLSLFPLMFLSFVEAAAEAEVLTIRGETESSKTGLSADFFVFLKHCSFLFWFGLFWL